MAKVTSLAKTDSGPVARKKPRGVVHIEDPMCKGCGFCIEFCPTHCLEMSSEFNVKGYHVPRVARPDACTGCNLCGLYCPDFAIFGEREAKSEPGAAG